MVASQWSHPASQSHLQESSGVLAVSGRATSQSQGNGASQASHHQSTGGWMKNIVAAPPQAASRSVRLLLPVPAGTAAVMRPNPQRETRPTLPLALQPCLHRQVVAGNG